MCRLGPGIGWRLPLLLDKQGPGGGALGPEKGQQEAHDLPEDVPGAQELRPVRRDLQGEEEAHLPVQSRHPDVTAERTTGRFSLLTLCTALIVSALL